MDNYPHTLGLEAVKNIEKYTSEILDSIEADFTWLDEILETAKASFQTSDIQILPKTPSRKKRKGRKRKSEALSFIRSSVCPQPVDESLNESSYSYRTRGNLLSSEKEDVDSDICKKNDQSLNKSDCTYGTRRNLRFSEKDDVDSNSCKTNDQSLNKSSHSYGTRRNLRSSKKEDVDYDTCETKKNKSKTRKKESKLSPTVEVPEIVVDTIDKEKCELDEAKEVSPQKIDVKGADTATEPSSLVVKISSDSNEASPPYSENVSPVKVTESPEVSHPIPNAGEKRVNNDSYVIEILSEEESALNIPVITASPINVPTSYKTPATDTDSGITSDDKERIDSHQKINEHSNAEKGPEADVEFNKSKPSSSSEELSEPPRTRTRTRQQQQQLASPAKLPPPAPYKESISSTTSTEVDERQMRMTRSRVRGCSKQPVNSVTETSTNSAAEDKSDVPRTRTRTRLQKRQSDAMEDKVDSEEKRHCTETETEVETEVKTTQKRRSSRLKGKKPDYPEDADTENSDENDVSTVESSLPASFYGTPQNMSSSRSFLLNMSAKQAITSSQKSYSLYKYLSQKGSFTGSAQKIGSQSRLNPGFSNFKSLLKKTVTPAKTTEQRLDQRKREFDEKQKKEQERLLRREEIQRLKMEERKKKREERMLKVTKSRQMREMEDKKLKDKKTREWEEKISVTDRIREEKLREEREKLRLRNKKQQEAEERRNQEEEERIKKLKEQVEENQRYKAMLDRKKEYEEEERQRKAAEEKRKHERVLEAEREKQKELERRRKIEEEREQEHLRLKAEREKEAARLRYEHEVQRQKQKEVEEAQKEKLRKLERERLMYEQQMAEQKQEREQYIANVLSQPSVIVTCEAAPQLSSSSCQKEVARPVGQHLNPCSNKATSNVDSYHMTPQRGSYHNYDITDLKSDDSTDEEEVTKKPVPKWAQNPGLKICLITQYYNCPNLDNIFPPVEVPDLNDLFVKKKPRFNKRTSSAKWDSPMMKSHIPILS